MSLVTERGSARSTIGRFQPIPITACTPLSVLPTGTATNDSTRRETRASAKVGHADSADASGMITVSSARAASAIGEGTAMSVVIQRSTPSAR